MRPDNPMRLSQQPPPDHPNRCQVAATEMSFLHARQPSARVAAQARALDYRPFHSPWGHPRVRAEQGVIELIETPVVEGDALEAHPPPGTVRHCDGHVMVACADGWVRLEKVLFDGAPRPAASFIGDGEALTHL